MTVYKIRIIKYSLILIVASCGIFIFGILVAADFNFSNIATTVKDFINYRTKNTTTSTTPTSTLTQTSTESNNNLNAPIPPSTIPLVSSSILIENTNINSSPTKPQTSSNPTITVKKVTVSNFSSSATTENSISLKWSSNTGVQYSLTDNSTGSVIKVSQTSYIVQNLSCGTPYNFSLVAIDNQGNESAPVITKVVTQACPAPVITSFSGSALSGSSISLKWSSNTGVQYSLTDNNTGSIVKVNQTSYTVQNLSCGNAYSFTLVAIDSQGSESQPFSTHAYTTVCP